MDPLLGKIRYRHARLDRSLYGAARILGVVGGAGHHPVRAFWIG